MVGWDQTESASFSICWSSFEKEGVAVRLDTDQSVWMGRESDGRGDCDVIWGYGHSSHSGKDGCEWGKH